MATACVAPFAEPEICLEGGIIMTGPVKSAGGQISILVQTTFALGEDHQSLANAEMAYRKKQVFDLPNMSRGGFTIVFARGVTVSQAELIGRQFRKRWAENLDKRASKRTIYATQGTRNSGQRPDQRDANKRRSR